jgi:hypothetical protein
LGELELLLADRIISTAWRLRRAIALEVMLLGEKDTDRPSSFNPMVHRPTRDRLMTFSRYEGALERSLYRALQELRRLQAERGSEPVTVLDAEEVEEAGAGAEESVSL